MDQCGFSTSYLIPFWKNVWLCFILGMWWECVSWSVLVGWPCRESIFSKFVDDPTGGVIGLLTVEHLSLWMLRSLRTGPAETFEAEF